MLAGDRIEDVWLLLLVQSYSTLTFFFEKIARTCHNISFLLHFASASVRLRENRRDGFLYGKISMVRCKRREGHHEM